MSTRTHRGVKRFRRDDKAAVSIMGAFWVSGVAALTGLTVDLSQIWTAQSALQSSTDAAALAAAYDLYNSTSVTQATFEASAKAYSALSTGSNANSALTNVSITITPTCFTSTSLSCSTSYATTATATTPSTTSSINGVKIAQSATVKLYFGGLLGISTKTITTYAAAQARNGISVTSAGSIAPLDTVVIVDTTASMGSSGSESCTLPSGSTGTTSIACALGGVQTLLKSLNPCDATLGCGTVTNGVATNPQSRVALMVFPPLSTAYDATGTTEQSKDYDCGSSATNPTTVKYNALYTSGSWPTTAYKNYVVLPFQSDYRASNSDTTLNNSSNIVKAVGGSTTCSNGALGTPGGSGSYGADAIRAAKEYLDTAGRSGATKAIILFSDGGYQTNYAPGVTISGTTTATSTNYGSAATSTNGSMANSQCQAAIAAALNAKNAGISVYTLAYNASTSSTGCTDGTALTKGATTASTAWSNNTSPCSMMNKIATSDAYFFSNDSSGACKNTNTSYSANNVSSTNSTAFTTLFTGIASALNASITTSGSTTTRPRLLKYSTT